ncbi:hypothetical protein FRC12_024996 [Ceratobasidium sp. 428]|nr:hypothetical protein FRC12_024996 [Ceratobasidium sp. 428]
MAPIRSHQHDRLASAPLDRIPRFTCSATASGSVPADFRSLLTSHYEQINWVKDIFTITECEPKYRDIDDIKEYDELAEGAIFDTGLLPERALYALSHPDCFDNLTNFDYWLERNYHTLNKPAISDDAILSDNLSPHWSDAI